MKKWLAILLAVCLLTGVGAMAQDDAGAGEGSKLPAPEEVTEIENAGAGEDATDAPAAEEAAPAATEDAAATEAPEDTEAPEETEIPEAEPTNGPDAAPATCTVWFEEGFGLTLPGDWVSYAVSDEDKAKGIRYALGDGSGARNLYIQIEPAQIADMKALSEAVENSEGLSKTGELTFGGLDFVAFIDARQNASCCATLWGDDLAVFIFTPQTDSDYMLTASRLMESFSVL